MRIREFNDHLKHHPAHFFLVLYGLLTRYWYFDIPDAPLLGDYFQVFESHFWEYLYNTSLKPPIIYLIHGVVAKISFYTGLGINIQLFALVSICNIAGVLLFYGIINTRINKYIAFVICITFLTALMPFEQWFASEHYMHFAFFITMYFIHSLISGVGEEGKNSDRHIMIASVLMVLSNSVNAVLVPITILFFKSLKIEKKKIRVHLRNAALLLSVPIISTLLLCSKNYFASGVFSPSNLGGGAFGLVTMRALDRDTDQLIPFLEKYNAPEWYVWCFKNSKVNPDVNDYKMVLVNARVFGHCYDINTKPSDLDLSEILKVAKDSKNLHIINTVQEDMNNIKERSYLLNGFAPELSLKWNSEYMSQSAAISFRHLKENPKQYVNVIKSLSKRLVYEGSKFLLNKSRDFQSNYTILNQWVSVNAGLLAVMILIGLLYVFVMSPLLLFATLIKIFNNFKKNVHDPIDHTTIVALTMSCSAAVLLILFSTIVGEENDRYMFYIFPYIIIAAVLMVNDFVNGQISK